MTLAEKIDSLMQMISSGVLQLREPESRSPEIWLNRPGRKPRQVSVRVMKETSDRQPRKHLEIYFGRNVDGTLNKITIMYSRLIWMIGTGEKIPANYEIHHINEDHSNNAFSELICVHHIDHAKLHNKYADNVF